MLEKCKHFEVFQQLFRKYILMLLHLCPKNLNVQIFAIRMLGIRRSLKYRIKHPVIISSQKSSCKLMHKSESQKYTFWSQNNGSNLDQSIVSQLQFLKSGNKIICIWLWQRNKLECGDHLLMVCLPWQPRPKAVLEIFFSEATIHYYPLQETTNCSEYYIEQREQSYPYK